MADIAQQFEEATGEKVSLISGSSGNHFSQIQNGAPFDAFFSADTLRPERLEKEGYGVPGSRFTYAKGRLVLWSSKVASAPSAREHLLRASTPHLAIGNPELAPYGKAAKSYLENSDLWESWNKRLVFGENIAQTFQFVASGSAELGLISASQKKSLPAGKAGTTWDIPERHHAPILQQAILLSDNLSARKFFNFIQGKEAHSIIQEFGYSLP
ncbi:MAG: molybdate ABC transporter substrate-binding protein [Planctomycetota bacterium]|nr:molybdate ABC transporter substrate-binding protein [Planctomycetota bacterium]